MRTDKRSGIGKVFAVVVVIALAAFVSVCSPAQAVPVGQSFVSTDHTNANVTVDIDHTQHWTYQVLGDGSDIYGGVFVMKRGVHTDDNITFSIIEGTFADYGTATPVLSVTLTPADFTQQYSTIYFATTPIDLLYGHTYTGVLASNAETQGAYQFFIKEKTGQPAWTVSHDLRIVKFNDEDLDGIFDTDESTLPDWEFHVTGSGYDSYVQTGTDGTVTIHGLVAQEYTITETLQDGWDVTTTNPQKATVVAGQPVTVYFGNVQSGGGEPPVAEPQALALIGLGLLGVRRRRS